MEIPIKLMCLKAGVCYLTFRAESFAFAQVNCTLPYSCILRCARLPFNAVELCIVTLPLCLGARVCQGATVGSELQIM